MEMGEEERRRGEVSVGMMMMRWRETQAERESV